MEILLRTQSLSIAQKMASATGDEIEVKGQAVLAMFQDGKVEQALEITALVEEFESELPKEFVDAIKKVRSGEKTL